MFNFIRNLIDKTKLIILKNNYLIMNLLNKESLIPIKILNHKCYTKDINPSNIPCKYYCETILIENYIIETKNNEIIEIESYLYDSNDKSYAKIISIKDKK